MPAAIRPERKSEVTQQIDILPTVLDLVGYPKPFFAFGSSVLQQERMPAAVSENSATWLIIGDSCQLRTDGENILWSAGMNKAQPSAHAQQALLPVLQAAIQQYNNRLLRHELLLREK